MFKRLISILFVMGILQGGENVLAADLDAEESDRQPRTQLASSAWESPPGSPEGDPANIRVRTVSCGLNAGEALWLAWAGEKPVAAALVTPTAAYVSTVAICIDGGASGLTDILEQTLGRALDSCREQGELKVAVETVLEPEVICDIARHHGFMISRQRALSEGRRLEFYTNLYFRPASDSRNGNTHSNGRALRERGSGSVTHLCSDTTGVTSARD